MNHSQQTGMSLQVVDANLVVNRPAGKAGGAVASRVAECTVGDETGVIVLIAKNEQGDNHSSCHLHQFTGRALLCLWPTPGLPSQCMACS